MIPKIKMWNNREVRFEEVYSIKDVEHYIDGIGFAWVLNRKISKIKSRFAAYFRCIKH